MKQAYNAAVSPPIPVLDVRLASSLHDRMAGPFSALVDTGSDATLVPLRHLLVLGAEETAPGWMVGITGDRRPVALFFVDVHLNNSVLPGIRVIADEQGDEVILGRDVLNRLSLFLDGPQQRLHLPTAADIKRLRSR